MTTIFFPAATIADLFTFVRCEKASCQLRAPDEMWLCLPHNEELSAPLYVTVRATPALAQFIRNNSIYGNEHTLDRSHYLKVTFRDDDSALISMQYQQIIGSRWLCVVPQDDVRAFVAATH
jgi:hypothetical protein